MNLSIVLHINTIIIIYTKVTREVLEKDIYFLLFLYKIKNIIKI